MSKKKTRSEEELKILYKKYEPIIEELASKNQHKTFIYFDRDDIKQEVRNICYNALKSVDESMKTIRTYLARSVNNRLNNFKRDNYYRYENPCTKTKCPMFNVFSGECTSKSYMKNCPIKRQNDKKIQAQINTNSLSSIEDVEPKNEKISYNVADRVEYGEIREMAIKESGMMLGVHVDVLIKYGTEYVPEDCVDLIRKVVIKYGEEE